MTTKALPPHGSLSRHKHHKCKCDICRDGYRAYQRSRYRRQGYGTWEPFVDAEPIREHLLSLRAKGVGFTQVAEVAGLHAATVGGFLYALAAGRPRKERATREIAEKILSVTLDQCTQHVVDATGTRRRLQALARIGWPMKSLGPHIAVNPATVCRLTLQERVSGTTAKAVADCFERLRNERPEDHGITPGIARRIRNRAVADGWPDPTWWEDMGGIDDPAFDPAVADAELNFHQRAALRREEIIHLAWHGDTPDQIVARLNGEVSISTVRQIVQDWRTGQKRDRRKTSEPAEATAA
ncbi:hypothetical protein ABT076_10755 [Streptomyces sp. NPDC002131]|uniref:hypothetical protein n=1 Tax=Streptomyces sp. NPDC002131 TaxID=3154535 RepID=UPI00332EF52B